jgi:hypothetical protein
MQACIVGLFAHAAAASSLAVHSRRFAPGCQFAWQWRTWASWPYFASPQATHASIVAKLAQATAALAGPGVHWSPINIVNATNARFIIPSLNISVLVSQSK